MLSARRWRLARGGQYSSTNAVGLNHQSLTLGTGRPFIPKLLKFKLASLSLLEKCLCLNLRPIVSLAVKAPSSVCLTVKQTTTQLYSTKLFRSDLRSWRHSVEFVLIGLRIGRSTGKAALYELTFWNVSGCVVYVLWWALERQLEFAT